MELAGGERRFTANLGGTRNRRASKGDHDDHMPFYDSHDVIMSCAGNQFTGCTLHKACGGAPCTSESVSPCGSPSRPFVGETDACRPSPPCKSPSTLRRCGMGTLNNILHVVSGGNHPDASPDVPCGLTESHPDWACDACRLSPHGKPLSSPCLGCTCSTHSILHTVSGGSPLCPKSVDPHDRKAETEDSCSLTSQVAQPATLTLPGILVSIYGSSAGYGVPAGCGEHQHPPFTPIAFFRRLRPRPRSQGGPAPCIRPTCELYTTTRTISSDFFVLRHASRQYAMRPSRSGMSETAWQRRAGL